MADTAQNTPLGWKTGVALALGVPLFALVILEVFSRAIDLPGKLASTPHTPHMLEMPSWMQRDANTRERAARARVDPAALEWLSLFEEGDGFRVRLIPNSRRAVTNTFSRIPEDRVTKYHITSNSLGFRGTDMSEGRAAHSFRVLLFGDSSSFGWGVNDEQTFLEVLESRLGEARPDLMIETANFAIPGDSSEYGRLIFERFGPRFEPDVFIFGFGANDAKRVRAAHQPQVDKFRESLESRNIRSMLRMSSFLRAIFVLVETPAPPPPQTSAPHVPAVDKKRFRENLESMAAAARSSGAKRAIVLSLCTPGDYAKAAQTAAERAGALYLNGQRLLIESVSGLADGSLKQSHVAAMRERYPRSLEQDKLFYVTSDGCHPNAVGHEIVGEALAELIKKTGLP